MRFHRTHPTQKLMVFKAQRLAILWICVAYKQKQFITFLEAGNSKITSFEDSVTGKDLLLGSRIAIILFCFHRAEGARSSQGSALKGYKSHSLWKRIHTFQRLHLIIVLWWKLDFQNSIKIIKHAKCNKIDEKLRKKQLYKQMYKIWMWREKHIQSMAKISFNYKNN